MATLVASPGNLLLSDIRNIIGGTGAATLGNCNTGTEGGLGGAVYNSFNCTGFGPQNATSPMSAWYSYTDAYHGCAAEDSVVDDNSCLANTLYGCGVDGDTYDVFADGCCGYYCTFVASGCI